MNKIQAFIHCEQLSKTYQMGDTLVTALNAVDLTIEKGELVAVLGPSGSGKSTLMNMLGCLDSPSHGNYYLNGENVAYLSRNQLADIRNHLIGFVFQSFNLIAHASALDNVALPLVYRGESLQQRRDKARQLLVQLDLEKRLHHTPNELSGGQRQRVAIARALITEPKLILADEPTGNLDSKTSREILELFLSLSQAGRTIIIVTHDEKLAQNMKRVIRITDGVLQ